MAKWRKVVYIAGKITGVDDYISRFNAAEKKLCEMGYTVINPVKIPSAVTMSYEEVIEECKKRVETADFLYMLRNWADSRGARIELKHFLQTHDSDENLVWYEAWGDIPQAGDVCCGKCLYHLPDIDEAVCVHEESPRAGDHTTDDDACSRFRLLRVSRMSGGV